MSEEYNKTISKFNEGVLQIQRLHNVWLGVRINREGGNYRRAKDILDSAWVELACDADKLDANEETNFKQQIQEIDDEYEKNVSTKNRNVLYKLLIRKEILLRTIQEKAGKGSRYENPDDDDID